MFYCLKGGSLLKKTQWKSFMKSNIYSFPMISITNVVTVFKAGDNFERLLGPHMPPIIGNTAVLLASYIIPVIVCSGNPAGTALNGVRGRRLESFPFPPVFLTSLQLCLGSPWGTELLCNTQPYITVRPFLQRSYSHSLETTQVFLKW